MVVKQRTDIRAEATRPELFREQSDIEKSDFLDIGKFQEAGTTYRTRCLQIVEETEKDCTLKKIPFCRPLALIDIQLRIDDVMTKARLKGGVIQKVELPKMTKYIGDICFEKLGISKDYHVDKFTGKRHLVGYTVDYQCIEIPKYHSSISYTVGEYEEMMGITKEEKKTKDTK